MAHDEQPEGEPGLATPSTLRYEPALDGLRGACLLAVLFFHSGFSWMSGGFLGVSTFFTLSGFLITTLLLVDHDSGTGVSLRRFWARRMRRLLPAAVLTVAGIVLSGPLWLERAQLEGLAGEAIATLFYVVNWHFVSAAYAYSLIFSAPSPLQHFWSLAIEGQFYLLFPLVVGAVLLLGGGRRALAALCLGLVATSIALGWSGTSIEEAQYRLYYGTDARAGELLVGALLPLLYRFDSRASRAPIAPAVPAVRHAGPVAALLILLAWCFLQVDDAWLYRGGFAGYAILSALVITAAMQPGNVVRTALSPRWLRWIGRVSYGAYLYHWPIFLVLTPERMGWPPAALLAARVAVTLALAQLSYRFVELPIRRGDALGGRGSGWAVAASLAGVAMLAVILSPVSLVLRARLLVDATRDLVGGAGEPVSAGRTFAVFGDSTAMALWNGLGPWLKREGGGRTVPGFTTMGCGVMTLGQRENRGHWRLEEKACLGMPERWKKRALERRPDVAIVLVGPWEVRNRRLGPEQETIALGHPVVDEAARAAIAASMDALVSAGASVVWLTSPRIRVPPLKGRLYPSDLAASEPARIDRLNELIRDVARTRPDRVRVVDLGEYLRQWHGGEFDDSIRIDGVHFSSEGASEIARLWLGPEILRASRELRDEGD